MRKPFHARAISRVAVVLLAVGLTAGAAPDDRPEDVGMSSERLHRINDVMQQYINSNEISGAVTMVSRRGQIAHFEATGMMTSSRRRRCARTRSSGSRR